AQTPRARLSRPTWPRPTAAGHRRCPLSASAGRTPSWRRDASLAGRRVTRGRPSRIAAAGQGVSTTPDGARYEGQFVKGKKSGQGTYRYPTGASYTGQWADDLQEGSGQEAWADSSKYEGEFCRGKKHGRGTFVWSNGCKYVGEFDQNDMHGEGHFVFNDGGRGRLCRAAAGHAAQAGATATDSLPWGGAICRRRQVYGPGVAEVPAASAVS
ncbi:unnamed protein product, partial [Prorocentrum cordatum]